MIKYLKHTEINYAAWDACVKQSPNALLYAYSWFLDMAADQWDALVYGNYDAVMPLPWRKKWGIQYLYQPEMMQQGGVFSRVSLSPDLVQNFINAIPEVFKLVEINLNFGNNFKLPGLTEKKNLLLSLAHSSEILRKNYSENTRRNIKKAEKENFTVSHSFDLKNIMQLFSENKGAEIRISELWKKRVIAITSALHHKGIGHTISLYSNNNQCIAGAFYVVFEDRIYFLFSGSGQQAKSSGAMHLLIHTLIEKHASKMYFFDFEGSNNEGLARFYKGFGSTEQNYPELKINRLPYIFRWLKK
ncbi:MAG: hypothetical protein C0592_07185 [Marinilabiliales bacterium]|nr:MAG: hypothetical protein C0592_07185 [Marinilabiliales bacterium]